MRDEGGMKRKNEDKQVLFFFIPHPSSLIPH
jgi:hypothetical protein